MPSRQNRGDHDADLWQGRTQLGDRSLDVARNDPYDRVRSRIGITKTEVVGPNQQVNCLGIQGDDVIHAQQGASRKIPRNTKASDLEVGKTHLTQDRRGISTVEVGIRPVLRDRISDKNDGSTLRCSLVDIAFGAEIIAEKAWLQIPFTRAQTGGWLGILTTCGRHDSRKRDGRTLALRIQPTEGLGFTRQQESGNIRAVVTHQGLYPSIGPGSDRSGSLIDPGEVVPLIADAGRSPYRYRCGPGDDRGIRSAASDKGTSKPVRLASEEIPCRKTTMLEPHHIRPVHIHGDIGTLGRDQSHEKFHGQSWRGRENNILSALQSRCRQG